MEPESGAQRYPEPAVGAIILDERNRVLLLRSHKFRDQWIIPGGHVELGETLEQAVVREVKEETGLDVFDVRYLSFVEFIFDPSFFRQRHYIFFDFVCRTKGGEVLLNEECQEFRWAALDEIPSADMPQVTKRIFEAFSRRRVEFGLSA